MVELAQMYQLHGMSVAGHELPDYLPAFLEFASLVDEAKELLGTAISCAPSAIGWPSGAAPIAPCSPALLAVQGKEASRRRGSRQCARPEDLLALERS